MPLDVKIYEGVGHSYMNDHGGGPLAALLRRTLRMAFCSNRSATSLFRLIAT